MKPIDQQRSRMMPRPIPANLQREILTLYHDGKLNVREFARLRGVSRKSLNWADAAVLSQRVRQEQESRK